MSGYVITSPNGRVSLSVELTGGKLSYSARKDGVAIVAPSPLGMRLRQCDLTQGLTLLHEHYASVDETYQIPAFKKKTCVNHANTLSLMLEKHEETLTVEARAYDDGVAVRLIAGGEGEGTLLAESTGFAVPERAGQVFGMKYLFSYEDQVHPIPRCDLAQNNLAFPVLVDCGANIECTPEYLLQFAYIGNFYARHALKLEHPRVALLNIGAEESKGMALQKEAYALLKAAGDAGHINFIGNIEAKEALKGGADVIVADGFSGNVMLKTIEGVGSFLKVKLKAIFFKNLLTKVAALLVKDGVTDIKNTLDPNERGATPFLGISKPVLKAHGSSNARAIRNAVKAAIDCVNSNLEKEIADNIALMQLPAKQAQETDEN